MVINVQEGPSDIPIGHELERKEFHKGTFDIKSFL
jgi:hypothetical protein